MATLLMKLHAVVAIFPSNCKRSR